MRHFLILFGHLTVNLHFQLVKERVVLGFFENSDRLPSFFDLFLGGNDQGYFSISALKLLDRNLDLSPHVSGGDVVRLHFSLFLIHLGVGIPFLFEKAGGSPQDVLFVEIVDPGVLFRGARKIRSLLAGAQKENHKDEKDEEGEKPYLSSGPKP
jgi:hypothetical protein